jgi:hypothetical protein
MPGHVTTAATVGHPAVYTDRPDFPPPAALDSAPTPVGLATWRLEMDMHFDYTMASKALATAILNSVGASNQAALKVPFHLKSLHFLTPQEMVDETLHPPACCAYRARPAKVTGSLT